MQTSVDLASMIADLATALLVIGGGSWAFFRFVRHRTLKLRLALSVEGDIVRDAGRLRLTARSRAQNIGLREFPVSREGTTLQLYGHGVETAEPDSEGTLADWRELGTWRAFEGRSVLEPDEPVEDQLLIELPDSGYVALKLELLVNSGVGRSWEATEVVVLGYTGDNGEGQ